MAIALVDHVGQGYEELSFKRGDTIRDLEPANTVPASPASPMASLSSAEGGLFRGTLRGRQGYFRGSHVVMARDGHDEGGAAERAHAGGGIPEGGGEGELRLQPLELLRELREAEELLQAKDFQVAALKAMKKREEQVKLLERTTRRMLSMHFAGWRRVVVDAAAQRQLEEKDEQIQRLLRQMSEQGGHAAAVASFFGLRF